MTEVRHDAARRGAVGLLLMGCLLAPGVAAHACTADCDLDGKVAVNELIACVGRAIDPQSATSCAACDADGDGQVEINELIGGVGNALDGCPGPARPDLVPVSLRARSMTPACITDTSEIDLALEVCVANRGSAPAGPFVVALLGEPFVELGGLDAGQQECRLGRFEPFDLDVLVDAEETVAESDEGNNFAVFFVAQPPAPVFCTVTPTVTATADPAATPTAPPPTATSTATAAPPTATSSATAPPPTATSTATAAPPTATSTATAPPPTATSTATAPPPTATPTATAIAATVTASPSPTPTATASAL